MKFYWILGNLKETIDVLKTIAAGNKRHWDHKIVNESDSEDDSEEEIDIQPHLPPSQKSGSGQVPSDSIRDLFKDKFLAKITLIQIYCWMVNGGSYYALTLAAGKTSEGSLYWGTALSGFVEVPAYIVMFVTLRYFGRTTNLSSFMIVGGLVMLIIPILDIWSLTSMITTFGLIGKLCISSSFAIIYIHSSEIFPTTIRNSGMGLVSLAARIGGMLAPYVARLGTVLPNLHFILVGLLALTAGFAGLVLPDTKNVSLPESLSDLLSRRVHVVSVRSPHTTYKQVPVSDRL